MLFGQTIPYAEAGELGHADYLHGPLEVGPAQLDRARWDGLIDFVYSNPSLYGGVFFDPADAGLSLHVAIVGANAPAEAEVLSRVPAGQHVTPVQERYSYDALRGIMGTLIGRIGTYSAKGTVITSISLDAARNSIVIGASAQTDDFASALATEFGSAVEVVAADPLRPVTCVSRYSCTPWRGGTRIAPYDGQGLACTYGFNARSASSPTQYMITAGHCDNENWVHDGYSIGTTDLNNLDTPGAPYGDFQRLLTFLASPTNLVYASDSDKSHAITSYRAYRYQVQGDYVCSFGVVSGSRCGNIVNSDFYYGIAFHGRNIYMWGKLASFISTNGDSGSPVFAGATALGVVSAIDSSGRTAYGAVDNAMTALGIRLCLDASRS